MVKDELDNLPPEERIKKLKELEQKKKKEIKDAQKKIRDSESEITDRKKWINKVPIPEVSTEDFSGLSQGGKELIKTLRGLKAKKSAEDNSEEEKDSKKQEKALQSLEDTVAFEQTNLLPDATNVAYNLQQNGAVPYVSLTEKSMQDLQNELNDVYQAGRDKGYVNGEEARKAFYATREIERREETYSFTEDTARRASLIKQLGSAVREMYQK